MSLLIQWTAGQRAPELLKKIIFASTDFLGKGVSENHFLNPELQMV